MCCFNLLVPPYLTAHAPAPVAVFSARFIVLVFFGMLLPRRALKRVVLWYQGLGYVDGGSIRDEQFGCRVLAVYLWGVSVGAGTKMWM